MTNWCCLLERPAWPRPNATTRRDRQTERETENRWGHQVRAVTYPNLWILDSHWPVHPFWPEHQSSLWLQMSHLEIKEKQEQKRLLRETLQSAVEEVLRSIYLRESSSFSLLHRMFLDVFSAGVEAWTHFVTTLNTHATFFLERSSKKPCPAESEAPAAPQQQIQTWWLTLTRRQLVECTS